MHSAFVSLTFIPQYMELYRTVTAKPKEHRGTSFSPRGLHKLFGEISSALSLISWAMYSWEGLCACYAQCEVSMCEPSVHRSRYIRAAQKPGRIYPLPFLLLYYLCACTYMCI